MKLIRYGPAGREKPGLIDSDGNLRDLSSHVSDIDCNVIGEAGLASLAALDAATLPVVKGGQRFGAPIAQTRQFIAIGLNYSDHAAESGMPVPTEPILFTKAVGCIQGPNDDVRKPRGSTKMDWEVELGIVIGSRASYVDEATALDHVAGYVVCDDLSE